MSIQNTFIKIPIWLLERREVTSTAKNLYGVLDGYSRKFNRAFPFRSTLAKDIGRCERTVDRAVKELERFSLIHVARRGKKLSNVYHLPDHEWMGKSESTFVSTHPVDNYHSESTLLSEKGGGESTFVSTPQYEIIRLIDNNTEETLKNEFEEWFVVYPRRQSRGKAFPAFVDARKHTSLDILIRKAKSYARQRERIVSAARGKDSNSNQDLYTRMAHTWLANHGWEDDYGRDEVSAQSFVSSPGAPTNFSERSPYQIFDLNQGKQRGVPGYILRERDKMALLSAA